jgi:hypothetical protein
VRFSCAVASSVAYAEAVTVEMSRAATANVAAVASLLSRRFCGLCFLVLLRMSLLPLPLPPFVLFVGFLVLHSLNHPLVLQR